MEQMTQRINVFGDRESLKKLIVDSGHKTLDKMIALGYTEPGDGEWMCKILSIYSTVIEKQIMPKGENFGIVKDPNIFWGMCQASIAITTIMTPKSVKQTKSTDDMAILLTLATQDLENALFPKDESEETENA